MLISFSVLQTFDKLSTFVVVCECLKSLLPWLLLCAALVCFVRLSVRRVTALLLLCRVCREKANLRLVGLVKQKESHLILANLVVVSWWWRRQAHTHTHQARPLLQCLYTSYCAANTNQDTFNFSTSKIDVV